MGVISGQGPLVDSKDPVPLPRDLIADGRNLLDGRPPLGEFHPSDRATTALAFGVLALAEQFRRFIDLIEKSEGK